MTQTEAVIVSYSAFMTPPAFWRIGGEEGYVMGVGVSILVTKKNRTRTNVNRIIHKTKAPKVARAQETPCFIPT